MAEKKSQKKTEKSAEKVEKVHREGGKCIDRHCPAHAGFSTHGSVFEGAVASDKPKNTVIVVMSHLQFIPKYERYQRRKTRIAAHRPECMSVKTGDRVRIAECRKISKTKSFVVVEKLA